jgi:putative ubiquitin-RnfH superfamily antitoxin RatB of RatAB toxin-antitoxin module
MTIKVVVAYATPQRQLEIPLQVEESCTVAMAIQRSGLRQEFPEIDLATAVVGIYSRKVNLDDLLESNDRIEIYRSLEIDPKEIRRLRAKKEAMSG